MNAATDATRGLKLSLFKTSLIEAIGYFIVKMLKYIA